MRASLFRRKQPSYNQKDRNCAKGFAQFAGFSHLGSHLICNPEWYVQETTVASNVMPLW